MIRDEHTGWSEAEIIINGQPLNFAESMSVRVAVTSYLMFVSNNKTADELGTVARGYRSALISVFEKMRRDMPAK